MDAKKALNILLDGAMGATMIILPGGGKRVVSDADRAQYAEAGKILQHIVDDLPIPLWSNNIHPSESGVLGMSDALARSNADTGNAVDAENPKQEETDPDAS